MELEWHQLDLRYKELRVRNRAREKKLLASISDLGQLVPIATVRLEGSEPSHIVIDGYKRVAALKGLRRDTVLATEWSLSEQQALLLWRSSRSSEGETSLEQAWLLDELRRRFDLTLEELAGQFERSPSWVSRRLALIQDLPDNVQLAVREGRIVPHAAAKYLVPLARANPEHCERLARATAQHRLSTRQFSALYAGWRDGDQTVRERLVEDPLLFLRVSQSQEDELANPREALSRDIATLTAVARRARTRIRKVTIVELSSLDYESFFSGLRLAQSDIERVLQWLAQKQGDRDARSECSNGHTRTSQAGTDDSQDRPDATDLSTSGEASDRVELGSPSENGTSGKG